jgi:hypothetical protein
LAGLKHFEKHFDLLKGFCYDMENSRFPLKPLPRIEIRSVFRELGNKDAGWSARPAEVDHSGNRGQPSGLAVAEIAKREETGVRTIYSDLETLQLYAFPPYTERVDWANHLTFMGTLKPQILPGPPKGMENPNKGKFRPFIENLGKNNHSQCDPSTFQMRFGQKENPSIGFF